MADMGRKPTFAQSSEWVGRGPSRGIAEDASGALSALDFAASWSIAAGKSRGEHRPAAYPVGTADGAVVSGSGT
jgi:hypothetical protein